MNQKPLRRIRLKLAAFGVFCLLAAGNSGAQTYFTNSGYGDLIAGFRKADVLTENNELVVYLGNITNFINLSVGTTINITNYSQVQITNMCPDNLNDLQWSVFATFQQGGLSTPPWVTPVGTFPTATAWQTQPRTNFSTPSMPPGRFNSGDGQQLRQKIISVSNGADQIAPTLYSGGATNQFNNILLVTEPKSYDPSEETYSYQIDPTDSGVGNFGGFDSYNIENTTPTPFATAVRSDLFQFVPVNETDPLSGQTTGNAYYLGYFTLNTNGTMTFTRDATVSNPQPQPPRLSISTSISAGGGGGGEQVTSVISFSTTNAATYTLFYTNSTGLTTPITNWPSISMTVTGDGLVHSFTNSSTDPNRFYSVGAK